MVIKALSYGNVEVGKVMKKSKRRFFWKFSIDGYPYTVEMVVSYLSGKKKLYLNGDLLYEGKKKLGSSFQFPFQIDVNMCAILQKGETYELKINNQSFEQLCDQHTKTELNADEKAAIVKHHREVKKQEKAEEHKAPSSAKRESKTDHDIGKKATTSSRVKTNTMPDLDEGYGKTVATDFKFEYPTSQQPKKTKAAPSHPATSYFDVPAGLRGERSANHQAPTKPATGDQIPISKPQTHVEVPKQSAQNDPFATFGDFTFPTSQTTTTNNPTNTNFDDFLNFNNPSNNGSNQQNNFYNTMPNNTSNGGFNNFGGAQNQNQANMAMGFGNQQNSFNNTGNNFGNPNNNMGMDFFNAPVNNQHDIIPNVPISLDVDPKPTKSKEKKSPRPEPKTSPKPEPREIKEPKQVKEPKEHKEPKESKSSKESKNSKVNNNNNVNAKAHENTDPNVDTTASTNTNTTPTKPIGGAFGPNSLSSILGLGNLSGLRGERGPKHTNQDAPADGVSYSQYGNTNI